MTQKFVNFTSICCGNRRHDPYIPDFIIPTIVHALKCCSQKNVGITIILERRNDIEQHVAQMLEPRILFRRIEDTKPTDIVRAFLPEVSKFHDGALIISRKGFVTYGRKGHFKSAYETSDRGCRHHGAQNIASLCDAVVVCVSVSGSITGYIGKEIIKFQLYDENEMEEWLLKHVHLWIFRNPEFGRKTIDNGDIDISESLNVWKTGFAQNSDVKKILFSFGSKSSVLHHSKFKHLSSDHQMFFKIYVSYHEYSTEKAKYISIQDADLEQQMTQNKILFEHTLSTVDQLDSFLEELEKNEDEKYDFPATLQLFTYLQLVWIFRFFPLKSDWTDGIPFELHQRVQLFFKKEHDYLQRTFQLYERTIFKDTYTCGIFYSFLLSTGRTVEVPFLTDLVKISSETMYCISCADDTLQSIDNGQFIIKQWFDMFQEKTVTDNIKYHLTSIIDELQNKQKVTDAKKMNSQSNQHVAYRLGVASYRVALLTEKYRKNNILSHETIQIGKDAWEKHLCIQDEVKVTKLWEFWQLPSPFIATCEPDSC